MAISERWDRFSKNNDFPGYSAQKIDKIQKSSKNVKKHEKTREIEIQYIYIWENPISRDIQTSAPDDGRSFLARVLRLRSVLGQESHGFRDENNK